MLKNYLPFYLRQPVDEALEKITMPREVRFRAKQPITICNENGEFYIGREGQLLTGSKDALVCTAGDLKEMLALLTSNSVYAAKEDLKKGFITIKGGHRAGLCGKAVMIGGEPEYIKEISSINIRIAREVKGCGDPIVQTILPGGVKSTLIISPPGCGKTTILRDVVRQISDRQYPVSVVDERSEIAPMAGGEPIFDIGKRTDVLSDCPKAKGMTMVLRTMNPAVIATDEIGTKEDAKALFDILNSGVKVITTFHGFSISDFMKRTEFLDLYQLGMFEYIVLLKGVGQIGEIIKKGRDAT